MTIASRGLRTAAWLTFAACLSVAATAHAAGETQDAVIIDTDNNVVLAGGRVSPGKPVPENFVAAGGRVLVDQPVGENGVLVGGSVEVRAPIGGNLRAAGGTVVVDSTVGGSFAAAGGDVRLGPGAKIGQAARIYGGSITIEGRVDGPLRANAERIVINGEVRGDVKAAAEQITLGPNAKIGGSLRYVAGAELKQDPGATVAGTVTRLDEDVAAREWESPATRSSGFSVVGFIMSFVMLLACGAIFLGTAPIFSVEAPERVRADPLRAIGMGLVTIIGTPIVAVLFLVTIVGIPVGVLLLATYPFALLLGFVVGTLWVASFVPRLMRWAPPPTVRAAVGHFAIALALVLLVSKIPFLGGWVVAALFIAGVGAFEVELYRRMRAGSRALDGRVQVVRP
jgi:cytoskeletal protein CcmA (bactofilin family)